MTRCAKGKTVGKTKCPECQNEITTKKDAQVGDIIECKFCGIELEFQGDGKWEVIEEEK